MFSVSAFNQPLVSWNVLSVTLLPSAFNTTVWRIAAVLTRRCSTTRRPSARTSRAGTRRAFRTCLAYAPCQSHARGLITLGGGSSTRAVGAVLSCICAARPRPGWPVGAALACCGGSCRALLGVLRRWVLGRHGLAPCGGAFSQMFYLASAFNQPIGGWNTARASSMYGVCSVTSCVRTDQTRRRHKHSSSWCCA